MRERFRFDHALRLALGLVVLVFTALNAGAENPPVPCTGAACVVLNGEVLQRDGFAVRLSDIAPTMDVEHIGARFAQTVPDSKQMEARLLGCGRESNVPGVPDVDTLDILAGRLDRAQSSLQAIVARPESADDRPRQTVAWANLGALEAARGRYAEARQRFEVALRRYQDDVSAPVQKPSDNAKAALMARLSPYGIRPGMIDLDSATAPLLDAKHQMDVMTASLGVTRMLLNLGNVSGQLGRYAEAEELFKRAAAEAVRTGQPGLDQAVAVEFAVLYRKTGRTDAATTSAQRANGVKTNALVLLGNKFIALGRSEAAASIPVQSEDALQNRPSRYAEAALLRMQAEAGQRERAGDLIEAARIYSRSAIVAAAVSRPEREYAALGDLARVQAASGPAALAILSGKRAVNAAQRLRVGVSEMDRQARQGYLADKKRSYTTLGHLLISEHRLAEAEQVLRLLKEDEGQQFRRTSAVRGSMPYTLLEAGYVNRYGALASGTSALEDQRLALQCGAFGGASIDDRTAQERIRLQTALAKDSMIDQFESGQMSEGLTARASQARAIAAKAPSQRSAAESTQLVEFQHGVRLLDDMLAGMGASLRGVRRDGPYFLEPIGAADAAMLDRDEARVARIRQAMARLTAFLVNEPPVPAVAKDAQVLRFLGFGMGQSQESWAIDRRLEQLDSDRGRLDDEARAALGDSGRNGSPTTFAAADTAVLETGRSLLRALPRGTAAVYYLTGEQQLDILLVTRDGRSVATMPVSRAQLEVRIDSFRRVLQSRGTDPSGQAKALYDVLVAPIEGSLQSANITTLMLALDGRLRYVPFAALFDGRGWLTERYAIDVYTTAAAAALTAAPAMQWTAAAFGSTAGGSGFEPLPAVRAELEGVVRDARAGTHGALPGTIRFDQGFTSAALRETLRGRPNVVHIASHFQFRAGDASESFLLLGDGSRLSLADLGGADYRFDRVDLVTLSACQTALNGNDGFGQEVEGLGDLLQAQGAAAVLATLWSVEDESTAQFMGSLYSLREQRHLSRAEALREAQLAFIHGRATASSRPAAERGASRIVEGADAAYRASSERPWAHPYFWAPFVLMGNWL